MEREYLQRMNMGDDGTKGRRMGNRSISLSLSMVIPLVDRVAIFTANSKWILRWWSVGAKYSFGYELCLRASCDSEVLGWANSDGVNDLFHHHYVFIGKRAQSTYNNNLHHVIDTILNFIFSFHSQQSQLSITQLPLPSPFPILQIPISQSIATSQDSNPSKYQK